LIHPPSSRKISALLSFGKASVISNLAVSKDQIAAFCRRWSVNELALFGSVLRADFSPESDVDVLVSFKPEAKIRFADLMQMEEELGAIFGRKVDLGTRRSVEEDANYLRRRAILGSAEVVYAE
jgi:predicted nucleotidyltransferase